MIPRVAPGKSTTSFLFVSQQADDCVSTRTKKCAVQGTKPLVELQFEKMKVSLRKRSYKVRMDADLVSFTAGGKGRGRCRNRTPIVVLSAHLPQGDDSDRGIQL